MWYDAADIDPETELPFEDAEPLSEWDLESRYRDDLDEIYPPVEVAGLEYDTSRVLEEVDPIAFRCGFADWMSFENGETIVEVSQ